MNCARSRASLSAYMDGVLPERRRDDLQRHLAVCPVCSAELTRLERLTRALQSIPVPEVPEDLAQRVHAEAVMIMSARRPRWWDRIGVALLHPVIDVIPARAAAAILLILGLAGGSFLGWQVSRPTRPSSAAIQEETAESIYGLDVFDGAPAGSIEGAYGTLAPPAEGRTK